MTIIIALLIGIVIGTLLDRNKLEEKKKIAQEKTDILVKKVRSRKIKVSKIQI